jgi:hypothetical protein
MVARRTHQTQGLAVIAVGDTFDRVADGAGRQQRHIERIAGDNRVRLEQPMSLFHELLDPLDVFRLMNALKPLRADSTTQWLAALAIEASSLQMPYQLSDSLGPFRVFAGVVTGESLVEIEECQWLVRSCLRRIERVIVRIILAVCSRRQRRGRQAEELNTDARASCAASWVAGLRTSAVASGLTP